MLGGELEGHAAAHRIAQHIHLAVAELLQDRVHVGALGLKAEGALAQRGAAVAMQVDGDNLMSGGQGRQDRPEHVHRAEAAVQQQQRRALAADLVIVIHAVHRDMAALYGRLGGLLSARLGGRRGHGGGRGRAEDRGGQQGAHKLGHGLLHRSEAPAAPFHGP